MKKIVLSAILFLAIGSMVLHAQDLFVSSVAPKEIVSIKPLANPDRGFHLESNYEITKEKGKMYNPYGSGVGQILEPGEEYEFYPDGFIAKRTEEVNAQDDGITLTQLYMYLSELRDDDQIPENAIENIKTLFAGLRENNAKAILRFAYRNEHTSPGYPTSSRTLKHVKQLAPVIEENIDVISVIQSGFIGQWGEWTPGFSTAENNAIMKELLKAIPEGYGMEMRYCGRKNALKPDISTKDYNRIGFNNDYFTGGQHPMACGGSDFCPNDDQYTQVARESFEAYVSGEVPHGTQTDPTWGLDFLLDTDKLFPILKVHHYTALDVTQNNDNNITHWKTVKVFPDKLDRLGIFYNANYFMEDNGEIVPRSFYQFVRDHLGYRLNVEEVTFTTEGENLKYDIKINNTGFATVMNPKQVYLILVNENDEIVREIELTDVNPKSWQPWAKGKPTALLTHTLSGSVPINLGGTFKVGIWIPDKQVSIKTNPNYCIRFANDNKNVTHWLDKDKRKIVNLLGEIIF